MISTYILAYIPSISAKCFLYIDVESLPHVTYSNYMFLNDIASVLLILTKKLHVPFNLHNKMAKN